MKEKILKLTNTVYKALEFFPESDPLKNRAKDKALSIMERLILTANKNPRVSVEGVDWTPVGDIFLQNEIKNQVIEDIDALLGYLWIAKSQNWLSSVNFLILSNEYEKIKKEIRPALELTRKLPGMEERQAESDSQKQTGNQYQPVQEIRGRQKQILEFLSKNGRAQVSDLQKVLPDITKRTIRRDLEELLRAGKIQRLGDFNQVFYKLASEKNESFDGSKIGQITIR